MDDLLAEDGSLDIGGAEVDPAPDTGVDDLLERVREAVEAPVRTRGRRALVADGREADPVGAEERLQRVRGRSTEAGVTRWMVGEARRDQRRAGYANGRVEERHPVRVGLGGPIAVVCRFPNRGDRPPEAPVGLVVPTARSEERRVG